MGRRAFIYGLVTSQKGLCLMAVLLVLSSCERDEVVMENLSQREANMAVVLLSEHNISAHKVLLPSRKESLFNIKVNKSQSIEALRLLVLNHIPTANRASLKEVYPPGSSGMIPTKSDEYARLLMATQGEIEALIKVIPGIVDVRVVLFLEQPADPHKKVMERSASVAIIYRPTDDDLEPPLSDHEVKDMVASSIGGLALEKVNVVQKLLAHGLNDSIEEESVFSEANEDGPLDINWYLIFLCAISLCTAAYSTIRLVLAKRSMAM